MTTEEDRPRGMGSRRNRRKRQPPKPQIVITDSQAIDANQKVVEMGIEPSRPKQRDEYEPTPESIEIVERVAGEVMDATGLSYELDFEHDAYHRVNIQLQSRQAGALIGRRGASIDALELLLGRMASHQVGAMLPIQVDVNEYRARKEDELKEIAMSCAQRVLDTGQDYHFEPMSARERRIIHITVKPTEGLETFTVGEGSRRHVVIAKLEGEG